jgi:polyhydroxyalkanoate synthase
MSQKKVPSIQRIDPFSEPYTTVAEKRPKEHYLKVYQEIFDTFPDIFKKLTADQLDQYNRQVIRYFTDPANLLSPTAALSNWSKLFELGAGVLRGTWNYWHDERVKLGLREPSDDYAVGVNVANTPSEVVYESELLEVKRYLPVGPVRQVPMMMFYSWINGYWILDLDERFSLMRHLRDSGIDAYITNWKIPTTEKGRNATLDDYLSEGLNALNRVSELTDEFELGICGYCIGGVVSDILAALMPDRCA